MKNKLTEELIKMENEDFKELFLNMQLSASIRHMIDEGVTHEEISDRLLLTKEDWDYILCGAYEFTTRDIAVIEEMTQELDDYNADEALEEGENELEVVDDLIDRDVPDDLNYGPMKHGVGSERPNIYQMPDKKEEETEFTKEINRIYEEYQKKSEDNSDFHQSSDIFN